MQRYKTMAQRLNGATAGTHAAIATEHNAAVQRCRDGMRDHPTGSVKGNTEALHPATCNVQH
jgi:hypothetical protein